ncbi:MAG: HAMP domain-containing histidine kinase [Candidatus Thiodiazotropha sp. (ex Ctena orbiculata)]|uniref:histidine kinase n=1 Tax=Candidatus Thiodiazotropha taylori TaxID=2792791 RepID=A0A944M9S0_9GAMM|nr:HAMP domain-containing histidine kinase [Candidatus Thiodiazotropha taylori]
MSEFVVPVAGEAHASSEAVSGVVSVSSGRAYLSPLEKQENKPFLGRTVIVPEDSVVIKPVLSGGLEATYWSSDIFGEGAAAPASYYFLQGRAGTNIAWLLEDLRSPTCELQLRRASICSLSSTRFSLQDLLNLRVLWRPRAEREQLSQKAFDQLTRRAALLKAERKITEHKEDFPRLVLTAATFEERLRQFERLVLDHGLVGEGGGYFVEAATQDKTSDLFLIRPLDQSSTGTGTYPREQVKPQDSPEANRIWRQWYWDNGVDSAVEIFNSLGEPKELPAYLVARTTARFEQDSCPVSGKFLLPDYSTFFEAVEANRDDELDKNAAAIAFARAWDRLNGDVPEADVLLEWSRKVYRPAVSIKVLRGKTVAGVYLFFGSDQLFEPDNAYIRLEALGRRLADLLGQPGEVIDEAARRESLRRLSWMMHQLSGPLMRMDNVLDDLNVFLMRRPDIGEELLPDEESAGAQAAMNSVPVTEYSLAHRVGAMAEAANEIRRLRYQIRRFKNSQRELELAPLNMKQLLERAANRAKEQIQNLDVSVEAETDVAVNVDEEIIEAALGEVINNACREFASRNVDQPRLRLVMERFQRRVRILIQDNAFPVSGNLIENPFDEDASSYSQQAKGTGLGLAIVRESFHRHGGRCFLQANTGTQGERIEGVTFEAELPIDVAKSIVDINHA